MSFSELPIIRRGPEKAVADEEDDGPEIPVSVADLASAQCSDPLCSSRARCPEPSHSGLMGAGQKPREVNT